MPEHAGVAERDALVDQAADAPGRSQVDEDRLAGTAQFG
jgi:hypothetical protein